MITPARRERMEVDPATVVLRQLMVEDVGDNYVSWLNDPETRRFLGSVARMGVATVEDAANYVQTCLAAKRNHWGIFVDGEHVGNISLGAVSHYDGWADVSNLIGEKKFRQSNLCKMALTRAIDHLFDHSGFHRVQAGVISTHFSGITLLSNVGMKKEAALREAVFLEGKHVDILKFGILKREWDERPKRYQELVVSAPPWEK